MGGSLVPGEGGGGVRRTLKQHRTCPCAVFTFADSHVAARALSQEEYRQYLQVLLTKSETLAGALRVTRFPPLVNRIGTVDFGDEI